MHCSSLLVVALVLAVNSLATGSHATIVSPDFSFEEFPGTIAEGIKFFARLKKSILGSTPKRINRQRCAMVTTMNRGLPNWPIFWSTAVLPLVVTKGMLLGPAENTCYSDSRCKNIWVVSNTTSPNSWCPSEDPKATDQVCVFRYDDSSAVEAWRFYYTISGVTDTWQLRSDDQSHPYNNTSVVSATYSALPGNSFKEASVETSLLFPGVLHYDDEKRSFCSLKLDEQALQGSATAPMLPPWSYSGDSCNPAKTVLDPATNRTLRVSSLCDYLWIPTEGSCVIQGAPGQCAVYFVTEVDGQSFNNWIVRCTTKDGGGAVSNPWDLYYNVMYPTPFRFQTGWLPGSQVTFSLADFLQQPQDCPKV